MHENEINVILPLLKPGCSKLKSINLPPFSFPFTSFKYISMQRNELDFFYISIPGASLEENEKYFIFAC